MEQTNNSSTENTIQREVMDCDVAIVGGGAAGLATAIHLQNLVKQHNEEISSGKKTGSAIPDLMIVVLEKGPFIGAHSFSGAVINPAALHELIPSTREEIPDFATPVKSESVYFLSQKHAIGFPVIPPPLQNHGNWIVSLAKLNKWLGEKAENLGINIFPGFAAVEAIYEDDKLVAIRTGDKGLDKDGKPKSNFEAGLIIKPKVTVFAEGPRGSLFKQVAKKLGLRDGRNAESFEEGVKEIIQLPPGRLEAGKVIHTMGFPSQKTMGGTFIYGLPGDQVVVGYVGYMNTPDPLFDPHRDLQRLKTHPFMQKLLEGGKVLAYGGKVVPGGGWYSVPQLYHHNMLVVGDTANLVDIQRLKGVHLAMKSGMLAAETILDGLLRQDFSLASMQAYSKRIDESYVRDELYKVRNFHHGMSKGLVGGLPHLIAQELTGGRGFVDREEMLDDRTYTETAVDCWGPQALTEDANQLPAPDNKIFFDKLSSVYLTGTRHDEDSPNHLLVPNRDICRDTCEPKYKSPCNHFCPAKVYEMVDVPETNKRQLQINYTNCIHCKSCDIKCPFDNITWTPPEGGGGPQYAET